MVSTMCCMDLPRLAKKMFCSKAERSPSSVETFSVFFEDLPLLMVPVNKVLMYTCLRWQLGWQSLASLRDFSHFLMVSCRIGLETREISLSVLEIMVKELLSGQISLDEKLKDQGRGALHTI